MTLEVWIENLAREWRMSPEETAIAVAAGEIDNRLAEYPAIQAALRSSPVDTEALRQPLESSWALGERFVAIRLNRFLSDENLAGAAIGELVKRFPVSDSAAADRIDTFVEKAVDLGFVNGSTGNADRSGAALLASVLLTSAYPDRFVDFRINRWVDFALDLGRPVIAKRGPKGRKLIWAGKLASEILSQDLRDRYWPEAEPNWVMSGICWAAQRRDPPPPDPFDVEANRSFPEGAEWRRMHLIRERSQAVVRKAKELAYQRDPTMPCEVCGFSFRNAYGGLGDGFLEAHHIVPVRKLKPGSRTRVEDLALVCANCHRMLHWGEKTLALSELREVLAQTTADFT